MAGSASHSKECRRTGQEDVHSLRVAPDASADEFDRGEVVFRALVIAGCDASEAIDMVEEALDEIALSV
jgi:hypothetical protein